MKSLAMAAGTLLFASLHLMWYVRVVAYRLWELSGGIRQYGQLTAYGTSSWAWTVPLHVPAGLSFYGGLFGLPLLFAGSLAAGYGVMACLEELLSGRRPRFGRKKMATFGFFWRAGLGFPCPRS
jgi:hypothetical protein